MPTRDVEITRRPLIVVAGPTAAGKSSLALGIARALGGVVINADSMQLYRDLAILTARPPANDEAAAPHRLYGILDGADICSAARWAGLAEAEIAAAQAMGKVPILCGGSGLYLRTVLGGIAAVPGISAVVRDAARALHAERGGARFKQELAAVDPEAAEQLHENDSQRLIRAYEVVLATGVPLSEWQRRQGAVPQKPALRILVDPPREELRARIDRRFLAMVEAGALEEVRLLGARALDPALPVMKALGVPELLTHLSGNCSLDAAIRQAQAASRQYAKRQATWFRHQMSEPDIRVAQYSESLIDEICQKIPNRA